MIHCLCCWWRWAWVLSVVWEKESNRERFFLTSRDRRVTCCMCEDDRRDYSMLCFRERQWLWTSRGRTVTRCVCGWGRRTWWATRRPTLCWCMLTRHLLSSRTSGCLDTAALSSLYTTLSTCLMQSKQLKHLDINTLTLEYCKCISCKMLSSTHLLFLFVEPIASA